MLKSVVWNSTVEKLLVEDFLRTIRRFFEDFLWNSVWSNEILLKDSTNFHFRTTKSTEIVREDKNEDILDRSTNFRFEIFEKVSNEVNHFDHRQFGAKHVGKSLFDEEKLFRVSTESIDEVQEKNEQIDDRQTIFSVFSTKFENNRKDFERKFRHERTAKCWFVVKEEEQRRIDHKTWLNKSKGKTIEFFFFNDEKEKPKINGVKPNEFLGSISR